MLIIGQDAMTVFASFKFKGISNILKIERGQEEITSCKEFQTEDREDLQRSVLQKNVHIILNMHAEIALFCIFRSLPDITTEVKFLKGDGKYFPNSKLCAETTLSQAIFG